MKVNVGNTDRVLRTVIGIGLLSLVLILQGGLKWMGLFGLIPLLTGVVRWCPLYILFGFSSCPLSKLK